MTKKGGRTEVRPQRHTPWLVDTHREWFAMPLRPEYAGRFQPINKSIVPQRLGGR